jgi:hypothetical protein
VGGLARRGGRRGRGRGRAINFEKVFERAGEKDIEVEVKGEQRVNSPMEGQSARKKQKINVPELILEDQEPIHTNMGEHTV